MRRQFFLIPVLLIVLISSCTTYIEEPYLDLEGTYRVEEYSYYYDEYFGYSIYVEQPYLTGPDNIIYIENFYNSGIIVEAYLNGSRISIPYQEIGHFDIEGSGYLDGGHIYIDATVWEHTSHVVIRDDIEITAY
ncbi:hypothetical protein OO013_19580 [Mangrovivirga sp. M17]|uniref:Lipoprotein n=1 Tax=Mangrovivirga halotolerans TaxID=2993936 RepID=A0ABT3RWD4_9BACT|nr:hypothetical protein [Mangrovivirga halotolerans]MCX2746089.1 hypothetical protein [Mangrovivirga halotolerans]